MSLKIVNETLGELTLSEAPIKWILHIADREPGGLEGEKCADHDELRGLTKLLRDENELIVKSLCCTYKIEPMKNARDKKGEEFSGQFKITANLEQTCVVTLERIDTFVIEEFAQDFTSSTRAPATLASDLDDFVDPYAKEPMISLVKDRVEMGPLVYQYFTMAIDPNPRKAGVEFDGADLLEKEGSEKSPSPFAALKHYKHRK